MTFELSGFERQQRQSEPGADAGASRRREARPGRCHRVRDGDRFDQSPAANRSGRDEFPSGSAQHAADDEGSQCRAAAGAVGTRHGPGRRVFDCRLHVLRESLSRQRRDGEREPARAGARSLHRRRDSGDDDRDRRHLGRIRPLRRRRRERDHQIGRQPVFGFAARHAQQRQLARADAVCRRLEARQGPADLRYTLGRTGHEGSPVVLYGRPASERRRAAHAGHHQRAVRLLEPAPSLRGEGHLLGDVRPPPRRRLHALGGSADQRHVQPDDIDGHAKPVQRRPASWISRP